MDPRKFAVQNQTRQNTLSPSVTVVNAALEPLKVLKVLIEGLPLNSRSGLWLTNFKGVPVARTLSPFDLIYLDKDQHVIHGVELSKDGEFAPFKGTPASALVLPPKSLSSSQTRAGDQLTFKALEAEVPIAASPTPPAATTPVETALAPAAFSEPIAAEQARGARFFSPTKEAAFSQLGQPAKDQPTESIGSAGPVFVPPAEQPEHQKFPDILRSAPSSPAAEQHLPFSFPVVPTSRSASRSVQPESSAPAEPSLFPTTPETQGPPPEQQPNLPSVAKRGLSITEAPAAFVPASDSEETEPLLPPSHIIEHPPAPPETPGYGQYARVPKRKYSWKIRLLRWLFPELVIKEPEQPVDRRRADRQSLPGLIAYYFTGGSPEPQKISNISVTGFYLHTDERWMPGTVVRMTLQRVGSKGDDPSDTLTVNSRIVRWGEDGEGFEFILADPDE
jgi:hypothetical protein